jgi:hypothetical protein
MTNGPPPTSKHQAAHSCGKGNLGCVSPKHLSWKTRAENEADKIEAGTSNRGERQWRAKLTADQVRAIRAREGTMTKEKIAEQFGVSPACIAAIHHRENWAWLDQ